MEIESKLPIIVERSKKMAALYALGAIGPAVLYLYENGPSFDFGGHNGVLIVLTLGLLGQAILELNAKGYVFVIFDQGIDDRSFGGVGYVGWDEMDSCHVRVLHGQEILAFRPYSCREFWNARNPLRTMHLILYRCFYRQSIGIEWRGWSTSPHDGCRFLNRLINAAHKRPRQEWKN